MKMKNEKWEIEWQQMIPMHKSKGLEAYKPNAILTRDMKIFVGICIYVTNMYM